MNLINIRHITRFRYTEGKSVIDALDKYPAVKSASIIRRNNINKEIGYQRFNGKIRMRRNLTLYQYDQE